MMFNAQFDGNIIKLVLSFSETMTRPQSELTSAADQSSRWVLRTMNGLLLHKCGTLFAFYNFSQFTATLVAEYVQTDIAASSYFKHSIEF